MTWVLALVKWTFQSVHMPSTMAPRESGQVQIDTSSFPDGVNITFLSYLGHADVKKAIQDD